MMKNETKKQTFDRSAGVLMSISSLPSDYGIGTMGKAAYEFADFVRACNHKYWQVLPIGSTTYGDSPYQSYSAFAGNPYFIDLDMLAEDGLLLKSDMLAVDWGDGKVPVHISEEEAGNGNFTQNTDIGLGNECYVSYEKMYQNRFAVLRKAFESYKAVRSESKVKLAAGLPEYKKYDNFIRDNADWIENYALFMAVKEHFNGVVWSEWDDDIRFRTEEGLKNIAVCSRMILISGYLFSMNLISSGRSLKIMSIVLVLKLSEIFRFTWAMTVPMYGQSRNISS